MAYSPDYQVFGRERRQCKVVRRDALHAPTPRSALPRLQLGWFPKDLELQPKRLTVVVVELFFRKILATKG
ncbi:hypothetical protein [Muribaculum intestinale]|uniref:hypothetical protein n=1 Tax=Muribaculum intestinale TaxID=1796646 RepID=UPI0025A9B3E8|nr:hypothetical protein [Muribaculum intestinale]